MSECCGNGCKDCDEWLAKSEQAERHPPLVDSMRYVARVLRAMSGGAKHLLIGLYCDDVAAYLEKEVARSDARAAEKVHARANIRAEAREPTGGDL